MKTIWLINPYGPVEGENWRDYSFNQFGKFLSSNGYRVIWWTSNFSHHFKEYRSKGRGDIVVSDNFTIRLVPTTSYKKNFSFGRALKDIVFARNCLKAFRLEEKPDIILSADSPLTFGYPSFAFAKKFDIPIVYDQMDLWPEFIVNNTSLLFKPIINLALIPFYLKRRACYRQLSGIVALGRNYLSKAFLIRGLDDKIPSALVYNGIDVGEFRSSFNNILSVPSLPSKRDGDVWCVFAGTFGPSYDIDAILDSARVFASTDNLNVHFIFAGSGPKESSIIDCSRTLPNVHFIGKRLPSELIPIYAMCDIGLCTYSSDSNVDMPDKFYDYTAAGLAVVNSLSGEIADFIQQYNVGVNYCSDIKGSLHQSILSLINDSHYFECGRNSFNLASFFDVKNQNQKLLDLLNKILQ